MQLIQYSKLTLDQALSAARDTKGLAIGQQILPQSAKLFQRHFGEQPAVIVTDKNTYEAAGKTIAKAFEDADRKLTSPFIFDDEDLFAEHTYVEQLEEFLSQHRSTPIAVGSGTINDLVKLAAHRMGRKYFCVATAASMDGYTAYGASITYQGSKQTFDCPAPLVVLADLDVIAAAPPAMKAWGYADLLAKITAGADWILADALGIEPIDPLAWSIVQGGLRDAIANPENIRSGDANALGKLVEGLMLSGFAMQAMRSSRPASGAEHQFSHLWDMQHHTHQGYAPSHGEKVGIGTLAVTELYERILANAELPIVPSSIVARWPSQQAWIESAKQLFADEELQVVATREIAAKYIDRETLLKQLEFLHENWRELRQQLQTQLIPLGTLRSMLATVGAPIESEQIGISKDRLRRSYREAYFIRRRYTVLDFATKLGLLE
ncbi:MAG: sn-glycerol-1-phosphate dehydrogenase [Pirellulaceae bacterium]|nr:sn-glycerol-1-phosphate dehydrogenase [Pirellulaceae bacterium]